jgi:hypothetical protein
MLSTDCKERPGLPGEEVDMRGIVRGAIVAIALVCVAWSAAWADPPEVDPADRVDLCGIYAKYPKIIPIHINGSTKPRIRPVVVHRCQTAIFRVIGGEVRIILDDPDIDMPGGPESKEQSGVSFYEFTVTTEASVMITVPEDYPPSMDDTYVSYTAFCTDTVRGITYECQGCTPPDIIIPPIP